jgi:hypothetical protein
VPPSMLDSPNLCAASSATHASAEQELAATRARAEPELAATHASAEPEPAATQACTDPEPAAQSSHPDFPTLGVSNAPVFQFFRVLSDELILLGPHAGSYKATYECTIPTEGGGTCGAQRTIYHKLRSCVCNSNLIKHIAQVGTYDDRHDDALKIHQSSSKKPARRRASASATKHLTARLYQKVSESMMR